MQDLTAEQKARLCDALSQGKKIEAIRVCRELTGLGLKEAKEAVEAFVSELEASDPELHAQIATAKGAGCSSAIVALLGLGATLAWAFRALS